MLNAGIFAIDDVAVTTEGSRVSDAVTIEGMTSCTVQFRLVGSGGTELRAWLQSSCDGGETFCDVCCAYFNHDTVGDAVLFNLSGKVSALEQVTPTNGLLADGTALEGVIGTAWRVRVDSVGTYVNTTLAVRIVAR